MRFKFRVRVEYYGDIQDRLRSLRWATNQDVFLGNEPENVRLVSYSLMMISEDRFDIAIVFELLDDAKTIEVLPSGRVRELPPGTKFQEFHCLELKPFGPLLDKLREVGEEIVDDSDQCDED